MFEASTVVNTYHFAQPVQFDPSSAIDRLHEAVLQYSLQSPAHLELDLEVQQTNRRHKKSAKTDTQYGPLTVSISVLFRGNSIEGPITVQAQCRLRSSGHHSEDPKWEHLTVFHHGTASTLSTFLTSTFPIIDCPLHPDTLWKWWFRNDKVFAWAALPTELKERVIEHCMHQPPTYSVWFERIAAFNARYKPDHNIRKPGPLEVIERLGDWYTLLSVSHQVRAITLRLCIAGGGNSMFSKGLCIETSSYTDLCNKMERLGDYYQMTSSNSIPLSPTEAAQSKTYERFPKIYPHLRQYATLRHGIRKIDINMNFLSSMHFFKVSTGGFEQYHKAKALTYEVFERLPCLNEIVVKLPLRPRGGWRDIPAQCGPRLWHQNSPCPRILHRVIYERIAEVLAPYKVAVHNFIDLGEMQRYEAAHLEAEKALNFTKPELEELYADDGGGLGLAESERRRSDELEEARRRERREGSGAIETQSEFFPPLCHCDEPCILARVLTAQKHH